MRLAQGLLASAALVMLVACGVSRPPLPPSLHLPQPVQDLKVERKGDKVTLTWTVPLHSTDHEMLDTHLGVTRICRVIGRQRIASCAQPLAEVAPGQLPPSQHDESGRTIPAQATFTDTLPKELQQQNPGSVATYAIEILNKNGRSAGFSNMIEIPLAPVPASPSDVRAEVTSEAVVLHFSVTPIDGSIPRLGEGPAPGGNVSNYRVYRSAKDAPSLTALGFPQAVDNKLSFEDKSFEWEASYLYKITPVTWAENGVEVEGEDSKPIEVFTHDVFPPAAPTGLQAVSSGTSAEKFIDLTWAPNTESDLAGYNLYRREGAAAPVRVNSELITTPAFRDDQVVTGKTYIYSVSAVDLRRNESSRSPEASEFVP